MSALSAAAGLTSLAMASNLGPTMKAAMGLQDHINQNKRTYKKAARTIGQAYKSYKEYSFF